MLRTTMRVLIFGFTVILPTVASAQEKDGTSPNFLIILTDDMGYTDLGAFGGTDIPTPNLDRLAWNGIRLTNFHSAPSCAPTRAMLMSGTGNHEAGMGSQLFNAMFEGERGYEGFLQPRVATMPEVLQDNGYHTMMSGKWHIGERDPSGETLPRRYGFSRDYTLLRGADEHYGSIPLATYSEDGIVHTLTDPTYSTHRYTNHLISFLEDHADSEQPFFAVYAPTAPHWPLQYPPGSRDRFAGDYDAGFDVLCSQRMADANAEGILPDNAETSNCNKESGPWQDLSGEEQRVYTRAMEIFATMVADLDTEIGRLLTTMEQRGQLDNTWVIYMNDNGPQGGRLLAPLIGGRDTLPYDNSLDNLGNADSWASIGQGWADAISSPFRNTKSSQFEGGIRVPAFAWHSTLTTGRIDNQYVSVMDIMPTLLDLAGIDLPSGRFRKRNILPVRGRSMVPLLFGTGPVHTADEAITQDHAGTRMMVKGDWKIVQHTDTDWQLFNLVDDPSERQDMSTAQPDLMKQMLAEFDEFARERNYIQVNNSINQP